MDENHQDKTDRKLLATENVRWEVNKKSNLWVPKHRKRTGFEDKTLWDWLQLLAVLAIPLILGFATLLFSIQQAHLADLQHQSDQQQALDQQQAITLQTYLDNIQDLLLNRNLLRSKQTDEIAILARARTITALQGLDPRRKGVLVQFLYDARLIGYGNPTFGEQQRPIISLFSVDISNAYLFGVNLFGATLFGTSLANTNLSIASLIFADLTDADLAGANLTKADLTHSTLKYANLAHANLSNANLSDADFTNADLFGATVTQKQLAQASSLEGATMPDGSIHP